MESNAIEDPFTAQLKELEIPHKGSYRPAEAERITGLSQSTLRRMMDRGDLPFVRSKVGEEEIGERRPTVVGLRKLFSFEEEGAA
ncbi:helix-turn-helix domain-containing protein [Endothiovibrio diazotrophicus]